MTELHGWSVIRENFTVDCENENLEKIVEAIAQDIEGLGYDKPCLQIIRNNGDINLVATRCPNHFSGVVDMLAFFERVAKLAPGSYGLIYLYDDEDQNGLYNEFQVFVIARGTITRQKDHFLSPFIPTVEDEEI